MRFILQIFLISLNINLYAIDDGVNVNIIDTGQGLASVISLPGNKYIIYDAGHWNSITKTMEKFHCVVDTDQTIDILVLSHTDSDHIAAADKIVDDYSVDKVFRTGFKRTSGTWKRVDKKIKKKHKDGELIDYNLTEQTLYPGMSHIYGDAIVTFLSGFEKPPKDWDVKGGSEKRNATSIVMRVNYKSRSILFMGDAVGRHGSNADGTQNTNPDDLIATEKFLVDNSNALIIDSDVLIASHHGANNGSASKFINAVSPEWVIFSAGFGHAHPRNLTAKRFLDAGVPLNRILRTDLGDDESSYEHGSELEWAEDRTSGTDPIRDDDIIISITESEVLSVAYDRESCP